MGQVFMLGLLMEKLFGRLPLKLLQLHLKTVDSLNINASIKNLDYHSFSFFIYFSFLFTLFNCFIYLYDLFCSYLPEHHSIKQKVGRNVIYMPCFLTE